MKYHLTIFLLVTNFVLFAQTEKGATPLNPQPAIANPQSVRAVVIGISDYQDDKIPDLRFADRDAEAFANFLRSPAGGSLDGDHLKLLTNQGATTAQFDAALGWLMDESKEGDQAIIYFSGHGDVETKTRSQQGFLLCWDSPPQAYVSGAYPIFFLKEVVSTLSMENKARVIIITDACRSGKLSGNSIGGSQLTSQNLAQQFANEIKILSCQPNEYSIEGEQWGSGRGAFSFHLLDGLYGLADGNSDASVNLMEIGRYLEDKVTTEVAPQSQVPMTVGNRTEKLTSVVPEMLAQVKQGKAGQLPIFSSTDSRGIEEDVLATVDTTVRELYKLLKKALKDKVFLEPAGTCADAYYERLIAEPKMKRLHNAMRRNYAAALQDDAQQAINGMMSSQKEMVRLSAKKRLEKYMPYPKQLRRAAELLGEKHYLYPTLQSRIYYFEAEILALESIGTGDSLTGQRLLEKYRTSLQWQPDAALTYKSISMVFVSSIPNADSIIWYTQRAIEKSPNLISAYTLSANQLIFRFKRVDDAKKLIDQAMAIDSSSPYVWRSLANWHQYGKEDLKASEQSLLKAIALDSSFAWAHGQLGVLYLQQNQVAKAERAFLNELKIDEDNYEALGSLGNLYYTEGNFTEAERYFIRSLENSIFDYRYFCRLADVYFKTGREEKADSLLRHVLAHDAISAEAYLSVGNVYSENGNLEAAAIHIQRAISLDSLNFRGWYALGKNQMRSERYAEAIPMFQRSLELKPNDVYCMNKLGESYRLSGDLEKAREVYINTHSINPESPISQMGMASLSIAEGLPNEAINFIEMAIQNGASFRQINIPEFNKLMGFDGLMKKHFPDKIKD